MQLSIDICNEKYDCQYCIFILLGDCRNWLLVLSKIAKVNITNKCKLSIFFYYIILMLTHKEEKENFLSRPSQIDSKIAVPDPVVYNYINYMEGEEKVEYPDCLEISLLRFLHLLFGREREVGKKIGVIDQNRLMRFMEKENKYCQSLIRYFKKNSTYSFDHCFYETQEGMRIRAEWGRFLNDSKLFQFKLADKYELKASISNLLKFYRSFFPKLDSDWKEIPALTVESIKDGSRFRKQQAVLNQIYRQLSFQFAIGMKMESEFCFKEQYAQFYTNQQIFINERQALQWQIFEVYQMEGKHLGAREGGHSDYRYSQINI